MFNSGTFTVELFFAEYDKNLKSERIFDLFIQNKKVLTAFNISKEAGAPEKSLIKTFKHIDINSILNIKLIPISGKTLLSGIEIIQE